MDTVPFPRGRPWVPLTCWGLEPWTAGMGQSHSAGLPAVLRPAGFEMHWWAWQAGLAAVSPRRPWGPHTGPSPDSCMLPLKAAE